MVKLTLTDQVFKIGNLLNDIVQIKLTGVLCQKVTS